MAPDDLGVQLERMMTKLTDTQLVLMASAARREDRCIDGAKLKGAIAKTFAKKLIVGGLAKEVKAKGVMPVWRRAKARASGRFA